MLQNYVITLKVKTVRIRESIYSKNEAEKNLKKLKLMLKYSKPRPIYITSKQDNNCFLQNQIEFEAERTAA